MQRVGRQIEEKWDSQEWDIGENFPANGSITAQN
jgi:hypothetical protein